MNSLPSTTHTAFTADHEKRLGRRTRPAAGAGFATFFATPAQTIAVGASFDFDAAAWTQEEGVGNHGMSLVDGVPHYSPGAYLSQLFVQLDFPSDGTTSDLHLCSISEWMLGTAQFATAGNFARSHTFTGAYYMSSTNAGPVTPGITIGYLMNPPGNVAPNNIVTVSRIVHSITRLGNPPA